MALSVDVDSDGLLIDELSAVDQNTYDCEVRSLEEVKKWVASGSLFKKIKFYEEVYWRVKNISYFNRPLSKAIIASFLSSGEARFVDESGRKKRIGMVTILKWTLKYSYELLELPYLLLKVLYQLRQLKKTELPNAFDSSLRYQVLYLKTDMNFHIEAGGSVSHITGILNNLDQMCEENPRFHTTAKISTLSESIKTRQIFPSWGMHHLKTTVEWKFSFDFYRQSQKLLDEEPYFIYQRYSLNNFSGLLLRNYFNRPLIIEYNGSEVWIKDKWGEGLSFQFLANKIEIVNLELADLVVVVSRALKEELIERGIDENKILLNPNGVNSREYSPSISGEEVREKLNWSNKFVFGFIGTFGKWHGAEVLAKSFGKFLQQFSDSKDRVRLLMIGDGQMRPKTGKIIMDLDAENHAHFTGLVPQEEGPKYLAACDVLVSPHVPNPDGSEFFGSPTKLFEYMAMGKPIVASDLAQIGRILEHEQTALLVEPGNPEDLMQGLKRIMDNEDLRNEMGKNAREEVLNNYTWEQHTKRILDKLDERLTS